MADDLKHIRTIVTTEGPDDGLEPEDGWTNAEMKEMPITNEPGPWELNDEDIKEIEAISGEPPDITPDMNADRTDENVYTSNGVLILEGSGDGAGEGNGLFPGDSDTSDQSVADSIPVAEETASTDAQQNQTQENTNAAAQQNQTQKKKSEDELEGVNLYDFLTDLCIFPHIKSTHFSDGCDRKIDCFFIDKARMNDKGCIHYLYGKEVNSINITQSMNIYGYQASVEILDINGSLTTIAEYQNNFYFVIAIITMGHSDDKGNETGVMIQPYVFEIEDIIVKSPDGEQTKIYDLKMVDIITATLGKVCYGNLLLEYPGFVNSKSFGELYTILFDYAAKIIHYSLNKKFHITSRVEFIDDIQESQADLIRAIFLQEFALNDTCRYVLDKLYKKAARQIEIPENFKGEIPGNVHIPLFVQDETEDLQGRYRAFFKKKVQQKIVGRTSFMKENETYHINATVIKRCLYGRTLIMPFELAFNDKEQSFIYENINPPCTDSGKLEISENYFNPMNGVAFTPIENNIDLTPSGREVGLGWKNLALISDSPDGSNNILIFFNWIYEYYKCAFLNEQKILRIDNNENYMMPIQDPHFHIMERTDLVGEDAETFAKMNANTHILKSSDARNEGLYWVGRMLKSFIFLNSMFGFTVKGSIFRHPGEIIKINSAIKSPSMQSATSSIGGISAYNGYVLAYMTSITHSFVGNDFKDTIYANKICAITRKNKK